MPFRRSRGICRAPPTPLAGLPRPVRGSTFAAADPAIPAVAALFTAMPIPAGPPVTPLARFAASAAPGCSSRAPTRRAMLRRLRPQRRPSPSPQCPPRFRLPVPPPCPPALRHGALRPKQRGQGLAASQRAASCRPHAPTLHDKHTKIVFTYFCRQR